MQLRPGNDRMTRSSSRERGGDRHSPGRRGNEKRERGMTWHRRRRPTLWDVREFPYGIPMPPPGVSIAAAFPPNASAAQHSRAAADGGSGGYVPGPQDIVRAPREGETGPLAGINIPALRALLNPKGANVNSGGGSGAASGGGVGGASLGGGGVGGASLGGGMELSAQETRQARRLYVGNLPHDTTDVQIGDFFNRALKASKGVDAEGEPIVSVYINLEKRFAFIETKTIREAAAGLALDGIRFRDMFLRLRRPNDYEPPLNGNPRPPDGFNPGILGIVSTQVSDGPNKVFIGGIPYNLTEDQIKGLLQSYGPLAAFNLIKEPNTGLSKGFAFFEFVDPSVVDAACAGLHGMQVGDKTLTVRRATNANTAGAGATHASTGTGLATGAGTIALGGGARALSATALLTEATRVVELRNVVTREELDDDEEFGEIMEDMEEEGRKFGQLEAVVIPRPRDGPAGVGRVYMRYSAREEAERAHATMSGRRFGEKTVEARFFDEKKFEERDFA